MHAVQGGAGYYSGPEGHKPVWQCPFGKLPQISCTHNGYHTPSKDNVIFTGTERRHLGNQRLLAETDFSEPLAGEGACGSAVHRPSRLMGNVVQFFSNMAAPGWVVWEYPPRFSVLRVGEPGEGESSRLLRTAPEPRWRFVALLIGGNGGRISPLSLLPLPVSS